MFWGCQRHCLQQVFDFWDLNLRDWEKASQDRRKTKYFLRGIREKSLVPFLFSEEKPRRCGKCLRQHRTKIVRKLRSHVFRQMCTRVGKANSIERRQSDHLWSYDSGKGKLVRNSRKAAIAEKLQANRVQRARVPSEDPSEPTEPTGKTRRPVFVRCCPKFTESKTDRAYEGFDENDVHFVCLLNEIGSPASREIHRKRKRSSVTWKRSGGRREKGAGEKPHHPIEGCKAMSKGDFWGVIEKVKTACGQYQDKYL